MFFHTLSNDSYSNLNQMAKWNGYFCRVSKSVRCLHWWKEWRIIITSFFPLNDSAAKLSQTHISTVICINKWTHLVILRHVTAPAQHPHAAVGTESEGVKGPEGACQAERAFMNLCLADNDKVGGLLKNKASVFEAYFMRHGVKDLKQKLDNKKN